MRQIEQGISPFSLQAAFPRHALDAREGSDSAFLNLFLAILRIPQNQAENLYSDFRLGRNGAQKIPENFFNDFGSKVESAHKVSGGDCCQHSSSAVFRSQSRSPIFLNCRSSGSTESDLLPQPQPQTAPRRRRIMPKRQIRLAIIGYKKRFDS